MLYSNREHPLSAQDQIDAHRASIIHIRLKKVSEYLQNGAEESMAF